jgi:hypothetical protein
MAGGGEAAGVRRFDGARNESPMTAQLNARKARLEARCPLRVKPRCVRVDQLG